MKSIVITGGLGYSGAQGFFGSAGLQEKNLLGRSWSSDINFTYGVKQFMNNGNISYKPKVGDFYIFPNYLYHSVNPFFGPGERRSISFNALIDDKIYNVY